MSTSRHQDTSPRCPPRDIRTRRLDVHLETSGHVASMSTSRHQDTSPRCPPRDIRTRRLDVHFETSGHVASMSTSRHQDTSPQCPPRDIRTHRLDVHLETSGPGCCKHLYVFYCPSKGQWPTTKRPAMFYAILVCFVRFLQRPSDSGTLCVTVVKLDMFIEWSHLGLTVSPVT